MSTSEISSSVFPCNKPTIGDINNPLKASATTPIVTPISSSSLKFKLYECGFCSMAFPTPRALGGHQTAHRKQKERLKRILDEADFAAQIYEADNDAVLCPEPIRWLPALADDNDPKPYEGYKFMPSSSDNVVNNKKKKNQRKRNLSESSGVVDNENKQKKRKPCTKLGECSENNKGVTNLSDTKGLEESTKLSECPENKGASNLSEHSEKKGSEVTTKVSVGCSEIKGSETENSKINEEQRKNKYMKLMPSVELTLATGAAPDVWVEFSTTDSSDERIESQCILHL